MSGFAIGVLVVAAVLFGAQWLLWRDTKDILRCAETCLEESRRLDNMAFEKVMQVVEYEKRQSPEIRRDK